MKDLNGELKVSRQNPNDRQGNNTFVQFGIIRMGAFDLNKLLRVSQNGNQPSHLG
jgi:hypothetical protein